MDAADDVATRRDGGVNDALERAGGGYDVAAAGSGDDVSGASGRLLSAGGGVVLARGPPVACALCANKFVGARPVVNCTECHGRGVEPVAPRDLVTVIGALDGFTVTGSLGVSDVFAAGRRLEVRSRGFADGLTSSGGGAAKKERTAKDGRRQRTTALGKLSKGA